MRRWLALAALLAGCGSTPSRPAAGPTANAPRARLPALPAPGAFYTPGLSDYAGTRRLPTDPLEIELRHLLKRSIEPPASLDCMAREHAARFAVDATDPDPGALQAIADHCGYWGRPNHTRSATTRSEKALLAYFAKIPASKIPGAIAIGVARHPDGRVTGTLIMPPNELRLDPVPRQFTGTATLKGRLLRGDGTLEVWTDTGTVTRLPITADSAGRFSATLTAPPGDRPLVVEIVRKRGLFRRTMALLSLNLPRQAGYAPPANPSKDAPKSSAKRPTPAELIQAINAARAEAGAPALKPAPALHTRLDGWLARMASGESTSAPPGMLDDRGWRYALTRYGFSSGVDAPQAVRLLVDTPTGRRALLDPALDQVAVGVRPFQHTRGFDALFVGLKRFVSLPATQVRARITAQLLPARQNAPVADAPALQALAQRVADAVLAGSLPWKQAIPTLMDTIRTERPVRGGFGAGGFTTADPSQIDLDKIRHALDPKMKHIGLGVAAGPLPGGGAPRYVIMYIVAEKVAAQPDG